MADIRMFPTPLGFAEIDLDSALAEWLQARVDAEIAGHPEADYDSFLTGFVRGVIATRRLEQ
jgi:hypothetical protein